MNEASENEQKNNPEKPSLENKGVEPKRKLSNQELKVQLGKKLEEARKSLGISESEVAATLKISVRTILMLEKGEHEKLPGVTFARGYTTSYIRFLGLAEKDFAEELESIRTTPSYNENLPKTALEKDSFIEPSMEFRSINLQSNRQARSPAVWILLLFLLAAGVYVIYLGIASFLGGPESNAEKHAEQELPLNIDAPTHNKSQERGRGSINPQEILSTIERPRDERVQNNNSESNNRPRVSSNLRASERQNSQPLRGEQSSNESLNSSLSSGNTTQNTKELPSNTYHIRIQAKKGNSWIQIADQRGLVVREITISPGKNLTESLLKSDAPYDITIGNAPDSILWIDNQRQDIQRFTRVSSGTARLKIGEER